MLESCPDSCVWNRSPSSPSVGQRRHSVGHADDGTYLAAPALVTDSGDVRGQALYVRACVLFFRSNQPCHQHHCWEGIQTSSSSSHRPLCGKTFAPLGIMGSQLMRPCVRHTPLEQAPGAEYLAGTLAIWRAGGIVVPLATSHPPRELTYVLEDAGISAVSMDRRGFSPYFFHLGSVSAPGPSQ